VKRQPEEDWGAEQKEAPLPGPNKKGCHRVAYSDRRSRAAAHALGAAVLFASRDDTGLLNGLPLLLAGLLATAAVLLATLDALLFLLVTRLLHPKIILHMSDARDALSAVLCATTLLTVIDHPG
jgi:hypothetical protein